MRLELTLTLECSACGSIDWSNRHAIPLLLLLEPYSHCPKCGSEVAEEARKSQPFRRKWRRGFNQLHKKMKKGEMVAVRS